MFDQLTERLDLVLRNLRGLGKITDSNIQQTVREIRRVLLASDVNITVIKKFISHVQERAQGTKVVKSIKPGELFIKIIKDELINLLGESAVQLEYSKKKPSIYLVTGLQGSGKTTTCVKLAKKISDDGKSVSLIAADIYRPAAKDQLKILGKKINLQVYTENSINAVQICKNGIKEATKNDIDIVIIDTAGRLHINEELMQEIESIQKTVNPVETLYVADGMTGQDAVNSAEEFSKRLKISGIILTKMDGDARGGAAISIVEITKCPIKLIGTSEKMDGLEVFNPERMVNRILGFGDVVSLVESAQKIADDKSIKSYQEKIKSATLDLTDFKNQLQQLKKLGSMNQIMQMMPGMNRKMLKSFNMDDRQIKWMEAIINSMTITEREHPDIINGSRRKRISLGSGRSVQEINQLLKQFTQMQMIMKRAKKGNIPGFNQIFANNGKFIDIN
ncbi:signal recognition particle protein [Candidatus Neomarinimicrobiota bacterium]